MDPHTLYLIYNQYFIGGTGLKLTSLETKAYIQKV